MDFLYLFQRREDAPSDDTALTQNHVEPICLLEEHGAGTSFANFSGYEISSTVENPRVDAMTKFCQRLELDPNRLLSEEFLQNSEFMNLMTTTASVARYYEDLVRTWQENQRFTKKVSEVSSRHKLAESLLDNLASNFAGYVMNSTGSCNSKILIDNLINLLRETSKTMTKAVPGLQACIRAQKARRLSKIRASLHNDGITGSDVWRHPDDGSIDANIANEDTEYFLSLATLERSRSENINNKVELTEQMSLNKCRVCSKTFHNKYQLIKHQNADGHKLKRGRPSTSEDF